MSIPSGNPNRNTKLWWEMRIEGRIKKKQWHRAELLQKVKHSETQRKEKTPRRPKTSLTIQMEEINQKTLAKEGKLKRYQDKQNQQKKILPNNYRKLYQQINGEFTKTNNQPETKESNFAVKYEGKNKRPESTNNLKEKKRIGRTRRRPWGKHTSGLLKNKTQGNTKLENLCPWWHIWILFLKILVHPR